MPIPKPRKGEERQEFISRCMGDDTMVSDFPDNAQRAAVCNTSWRKAKGIKEEQFSFDYAFVDSDIIDKYIRITKKECSDFEDGSLAVTELDDMGGVSAIVGRMKGDKGNAIQAYLFIKEQWAKDQALDFVSEAEATGVIRPKDNKETIIAKIQDILDALTEAPEELATEFTQADLKEIKGVEIFAVGKWNGDNYSVDDLHDIAVNFPKLKGRLQPFVKLGHDGGQKLIQKDGFPAAGWIENVYVKGDKLLADIVDMPKKIYDLIKNKAYKRISSEIYWNLKDQGQVYKRALKAIALLGGDTPAVGSLADVQALYTKRYHEVQIDGELKLAEYGENTKKGDDAVMEKEFAEAKAKIQELEASLEEKDKQYSELETKLEALEKDYSVLEAEGRKREVVAKVDDLINSKKVLPAQKDYMIEALMKDSDLKSYTEEDKSLDDHPLVKMFSEGADVVDTTESSEEGEAKEEGEKVAEEKVAENIKNAESYDAATLEYINQEVKGDDTNA